MIRREMSHNQEELAEIIESRDNNLTAEQRVILDAVMAQINQGGNQFFFLDAPGTDLNVVFSIDYHRFSFTIDTLLLTMLGHLISF